MLSQHLLPSAGADRKSSLLFGRSQFFHFMQLSCSSEGLQKQQKSVLPLSLPVVVSYLLSDLLLLLFSSSSHLLRNRMSSDFTDRNCSLFLDCNGPHFVLLLQTHQKHLSTQLSEASEGAESKDKQVAGKVNKASEKDERKDFKKEREIPKKSSVIKNSEGD